MLLSQSLLEEIRHEGLAVGRFRGLLYLLVGRRIERGAETVSAGMTWRDAATLLKKIRWDKEAVRELSLNPADLPPRDREKYWYVAISQADLGGAEAKTQGEGLADALRERGYKVE
ncbi:MAG: hypothetical protein EBV06_17695 [Planctomycetia bacterium]|nr:hypothetical protein [Planctomycetia bacterium]